MEPGKKRMTAGVPFEIGFVLALIGFEIGFVLALIGFELGLFLALLALNWVCFGFVLSE